MEKELAGKLTESDTGTEDVKSGLEARNCNGVVMLNFVLPFTAPAGNADTVTVIPDVNLPERFCPADPVRFPISIDGQYAEIFITDDGVISTRAAFATTTSMPLRGTVVYQVWKPVL